MIPTLNYAKVAKKSYIFMLRFEYFGTNYMERNRQEKIGLKRLTGVERLMDKQRKKTKEIACFVSIKNNNLFKYEEGVRPHWEIEKRLHYVKDVT